MISASSKQHAIPCEVGVLFFFALIVSRRPSRAIVDAAGLPCYNADLERGR